MLRVSYNTGQVPGTCVFLWSWWLRTDLGKEVPTGLALDPKAVTCLGLALCPPTRQMRGARLPAEGQIQICGAWSQERCWEVLPDHPLLQRIMMKRAAVLCWACMHTPVLGTGMQVECRINRWIIHLFQKQPKLNSHKVPGPAISFLEVSSNLPHTSMLSFTQDKTIQCLVHPGTPRPQGQHGRRWWQWWGWWGHSPRLSLGTNLGVRTWAPFWASWAWGCLLGSWRDLQLRTWEGKPGVYRVVVPGQGVASGLFKESAWWSVGHSGDQSDCVGSWCQWVGTGVDQAAQSKHRKSLKWLSDS